MRLLEEALMNQKIRDENALRAQVSASPELKTIGDPWFDIEKALATQRDLALEASYIEGAAGFNSRLFRFARTLVRAAAEREKANGDRLREFTDAALPRVRQTLAAPAPLYPELERLTLSFGLERMREWLGPDHPQVRALLAKDSPDSPAEALVGGTKLADPAVRLALVGWRSSRNRSIDRSDDQTRP
jgi:hypothetical protein